MFRQTLHHTSYLWRPLSGGAHFTFTSACWPPGVKSSSRSLGNATTKRSPFSLFLFLQLLVLLENQGRCQTSSVNLTSCHSLPPPPPPPASFLLQPMRSDALVCERSQDRLGGRGQSVAGCLFKEIRAAALTYSTYLSIVFHPDDGGKTCRAASGRTTARCLDRCPRTLFDRKVTRSELDIAFSRMKKKFASRANICTVPPPFVCIPSHGDLDLSRALTHPLPTGAATRTPFRRIFPYRRNAIPVTSAVSPANLPVI